jgi:hypothetical protein
VTSFYERAAGLPEGHSSYFEQPHRTLDPSLFDGIHLRPEVRERLLVELEDGLSKHLDLTGINEWLHAWLAGSGITYHWEGGEGDLDVLFGVDMLRFVHWNPNFTGVPESAVAQWADDKLRKSVWPKTAHTRFGQRTYEVTFYWNPGTHNRIENIKPYAAYDLKTDTWAVEPPELPADPRELYPAEWYAAAGYDTGTAREIARRHGHLTQVLATTDPSTATGRNAAAELGRVRLEARSLFDDIHHGRRAAFGEQGRGYSDWANFRWQHAKAAGVVPALRGIIEGATAASEAEETRLYGGPIDAADALVTREMMRYGPRP